MGCEKLLNNFLGIFKCLAGICTALAFLGYLELSDGFSGICQGLICNVFEMLFLLECLVCFLAEALLFL